MTDIYGTCNRAVSSLSRGPIKQAAKPAKALSSVPTSRFTKATLPVPAGRGNLARGGPAGSCMPPAGSERGPSQRTQAECLRSGGTTSCERLGIELAWAGQARGRDELGRTSAGRVLPSDTTGSNPMPSYHWQQTFQQWALPAAGSISSQQPSPRCVAVFVLSDVRSHDHRGLTDGPEVPPSTGVASS